MPEKEKSPSMPVVAADPPAADTPVVPCDKHPIDPSHTHVRCEAASSHPGVFVSHRLLLLDAQGNVVNKGAGHLTYCTALKPDRPDGYHSSKAQQVKIPRGKGVTHYTIADSQTSLTEDGEEPEHMIDHGPVTIAAPAKKPR